jgi:hypothetical protein
MENECFLPLEIALGSMSSGSRERGWSSTVATPTTPATVSRKRGGALGVCFQSYSLSSLFLSCTRELNTKRHRRGPIGEQRTLKERVSCLAEATKKRERGRRARR